MCNNANKVAKNSFAMLEVRKRYTLAVFEPTILFSLCHVAFRLG
jgi:hypothetical protein